MAETKDSSSAKAKESELPSAQRDNVTGGARDPGRADGDVHRGGVEVNPTTGVVKPLHAETDSVTATDKLQDATAHGSGVGSLRDVTPPSHGDPDSANAVRATGDSTLVVKPNGGHPHKLAAGSDAATSGLLPSTTDMRGANDTLDSASRV